MRGVLRTIRYARGWNASPEVTVEETEIIRDGQPIPATLVLPTPRPRPVGAWIALGGVSRLGRFHPQLVRFTRALASTGAAVVVPEVPEWRDLDVTPRPALPTIRACFELLDRRPEVRPGKRGLLGFSFGAPQVAISATRPGVADRVAGAVLFGSYGSLERIILYLLTGSHEWEGTEYQASPDPYGRWVLAGRYLTDAPGYEDAHDVARALQQLACAASEQRIPAWDPRHDPLIEEQRRALPADRRAIFDLFATPTHAERPERAQLLAMSHGLFEACRRVEPLLDLEQHLEGATVPTHLFHGRGDRLIPYTETLRFGRLLPRTARQRLTVTALFGHTANQAPTSRLERVREGATFFEALRNVVNTV